MTISTETIQKLKQVELMVLDGWSLTYSLNKCGLIIGNKNNYQIMQTDEYKELNKLYFKLKYNKRSKQNGFME